MPQAAKSGGSAAPKIPDGQTPEQAPSAEPSHLRYVGTRTLTYPHVPITVRPGDVVDLPDPDPDDGLFEATTAPVTRWPDNDPRSAPALEPNRTKPEGD